MIKPNNVIFKIGLQIIIIVTLSTCTTTSPEVLPISQSPTLEKDKSIDPTIKILSTTPSPISKVHPTPIVGTMTLEIEKVDTQTIYNQVERTSIGKGIPYFFWPDGNIAILPSGDDFYFFSPNGDRTAITRGSFDYPGANLEASKLAIAGIDSEFSYAAGGSLYRDPESDILIMFYHAERHFGTGGRVFHSAIGMAVSKDSGKSFQNLGIILESNDMPNVEDPCCVDMGGASFTIKDGQFLLYFKDRMDSNVNINLAVATAPVAEVVSAARIGKISPWFKFYKDGQQPGISGLASPLERGNPDVNWVSVSYNEFVKKFILVLSYHPGNDMNDSSLYLISSDDGLNWSPRVPLLLNCECELTYPSIINPNGDPLSTGKDFYIYYITTPRGSYRWENTSLNRMTVSLTGNILEAPQEWEFNSDGNAEGWGAINQISEFNVKGGLLTTKSNGFDPYMVSPWLAIDAGRYTTIEITMKSSVAGNSQIFFISDEVIQFTEPNSIRFTVQGDGNPHIYTLDMKSVRGWNGIVSQLRLDPIDKLGEIEIDSIRVSKQE